jgi:hypothetical protein
MSGDNDGELPALLLEKEVSDHLKETWKGELVLYFGKVSTRS